jgi:hypothetical protein
MYSIVEAVVIRVDLLIAVYAQPDHRQIICLQAQCFYLFARWVCRARRSASGDHDRAANGRWRRRAGRAA